MTNSAGRRRNSGSTSTLPCGPERRSSRPRTSSGAEINAAVRHGLEDEGVLHGSELEIERYVNLHLTRSQKGDIANYRKGDVAVFHHDVYGVRAKAGDACPVAKVGDERVVLTLPGGKERTIDPLRLYSLPPRSLRDPADGAEGRRPGALDPQRFCAKPDQRRACGSAVHPPG